MAGGTRLETMLKPMPIVTVLTILLCGTASGWASEQAVESL